MIYLQGQLCCKTLITTFYCSKTPFMEADEKNRAHSLIQLPQKQFLQITSTEKMGDQSTKIVFWCRNFTELKELLGILQDRESTQFACQRKLNLT